jgi:hypothetical protein
MKRRFGATVTLWRKKGYYPLKEVIKRVIRRMAQTPDETTYVEIPLLSSQKKWVGNI